MEEGIKEIISKQKEIWEKTASALGTTDMEIKKLVYDQVNKDLRIKQMNKGKKERKPTGKQLAKIQQLGGDLNKCKTLQEASDYIDELIKKKQGANNGEKE